MATETTKTPLQKLRAHRAKRPEHGEPNFLAWTQGETLAQTLMWLVRQAPAETSHAMMMGALEYLHLLAVGTWGATAVAEAQNTAKPAKAPKCGTAKRTIATAARSTAKTRSR